MVFKYIKTIAMAAALGATLVSGNAMAITTATATATVQKDTATELLIIWSGDLSAFSSTSLSADLTYWNIFSLSSSTGPVSIPGIISPIDVWTEGISAQHVVKPHEETRFGPVFSTVLVGVLGSTSTSSISKMAPHDGTDWTQQANFETPHWDHYSYTVTSNLNGTGMATLSALHPVPEPESYAMMLVGLGLMGTIARRRSKSKAS